MRRLPPLALLLLACGEEAPAGPDPSRVFEVRARESSVTDVPFLQEVPSLFRTPEKLPVLSTPHLATLGGATYAGGAGGLFRLGSGEERFLPVALSAGPVQGLAVEGGRLYALRPAAVDVLDEAGALARSLPVPTSTAGEVLLAVAADQGEAWALSDRALHQAGAAGRRFPLAGGRALAVGGGVAYVATSTGVARLDLGSGQMLSTWTLAETPRALLLSSPERALYLVTSGAVQRLSLGDGAPERAPLGGLRLPTGDLRALALGPRGLLLAHGVGASLAERGPDGAWTRMQHYHSERWIPAEEVLAVAHGAGGELWLGTAGGVARLAQVQTTLADKERANEAFLQERHWRMDGFVDDNVRFADPWDLRAPPRTGDHDNDGLWTEMQIGTWCFAYAVTGDDRYYRSARRAMDVMQLQFDVPAATFAREGKAPGFITRSLVRDDEGAVFSEKAAMSNWHLQELGGRMYYWKDDTSSDEYAGHYWGIPLFYDLCAQSEAEKEELRRRIRQSTDYLIAGGYVLYDLDGAPTTHGHWEDLGAAAFGLDRCTIQGHGIDTCLSSYYGGGWLNSLEILGHLLATWHLTGDDKYYREYERLYTEENYGQMLDVHADTWTVTNPRIANHSDHELAMLAYYTLMRYEPNPERRQVLEKSIRDFYEYEREEHNPWQVATIASIYPGEVDTGAAIQVLQEMPLDWRQVLYDNSHRTDAEDWPDGRHGEAQFSRVFPYDEIRTMKWNGSPYAKVGGGDARGVLAPTPWLIAYWMLRYHGVLR